MVTRHLMGPTAFVAAQLADNRITLRFSQAAEARAVVPSALRASIYQPARPSKRPVTLSLVELAEGIPSLCTSDLSPGIRMMESVTCPMSRCSRPTVFGATSTSPVTPTPRTEHRAWALLQTGVGVVGPRSPL